MAINSKEELKRTIVLRENEEAFIEEKSLPILLSDEIIPLLKEEAIRIQFVPQKEENEDTIGYSDPQEEGKYSPLSRVVHRYENRIALIVTNRCFAYCRHCFRRRINEKTSSDITISEINDVSEYLKNHREIKEVLLTGGDLFALSDEKIDYMLSSFKSVRSDIVYRLCTRAVFTNPDRFTENLFSIIKKNSVGSPFYLMTQFNNAIEITEKAEGVLKKFSELMIPMMNQSVLLKGVNDSLDAQRELSERLIRNRVKPYYLFQGDLVRGTAHLRVKLSRALELEEEMRRDLSGLEMPEVMIDLPEGGGKLILTKARIERKDENTWAFKSLDGRVIEYPEGL